MGAIWLTYLPASITAKEKFTVLNQTELGAVCPAGSLVVTISTAELRGVSACHGSLQFSTPSLALFDALLTWAGVVRERLVQSRPSSQHGKN